MALNRQALIGLGLLAVGLWMLMRRGDESEFEEELVGNVRVKIGSVDKEVQILNLIGEIKAEYSFLSEVPDILILGIAKTESSLNPNVTGSSGEYGLMQVMPLTWEWACQSFGVNFPDHYDPKQNLTVGMMVLYLYNGQLGGDWGATTQAYNVGVGGYKNGRRNDYPDRVAKNMGLSAGSEGEA